MAEGILPKNNGEPITATDINYISNAMKGAFISKANALYNSSSTRTWENMFVDIFADSSNEDSSTGFDYVDLGSWGIYYLDNGSGTYKTKKIMKSLETVTYSYLYVNYQILNLLDNFEDGTIGASWTTNGGGDNYSVTETNGYLQLYIDADGNSTYSEAVYTGVNYYQTTKKIVFLVHIAGGTNSGNGSYKVIITDGTTDITLKSYADENKYHLIEILFNGTSNTADIYVDGVLDSSSVDLSSLGTTWNIKFKLTGTSTYAMYMKVYWLTDDSISSPTTTVTGKVSTDDGTTWQDVNVNNFYKLTSTGKEIRIGWDATLGTGEMLVVYNHGFLGV